MFDLTLLFPITELFKISINWISISPRIDSNSFPSSFFFSLKIFARFYFIGGAYSILTKAEIKLKTDRISFERRKQGINRAKTFWPENRSRGGYGWHWEVWRGFRQQTVWTGFWPVILLTPVIVHGVDTFSPIELVVFAPYHLHFPRSKKK